MVEDRTFNTPRRFASALSRGELEHAGSVPLWRGVPNGRGVLIGRTCVRTNQGNFRVARQKNSCEFFTARSFPDCQRRETFFASCPWIRNDSVKVCTTPS